MAIVRQHVPLDQHLQRFEHQERRPPGRAAELRREMFQLGLCDASTCVRQAVVGFCEVRAPFPSATEFGPEVLNAARQRSDIVPKLEDDDTAAETRKAKKSRA